MRYTARGRRMTSTITAVPKRNPIVSTSVFLTERSRVVSSSDLLAPTMTAAVANGTAIGQEEIVYYLCEDCFEVLANW